MNRLQELIGRLKEQSEQQAAPSQMLATTQLIEAELQRMSQLPPNGTAGTNGRGSAKVAVMMPSAIKNTPVGRDSRNAGQTAAYAYNRYNTPGNTPPSPLPSQEPAPSREPVASREPAPPPETSPSREPVFPDQDSLQQDQHTQVNGNHTPAGASAGPSREPALAPKESAPARNESASVSKEYVPAQNEPAPAQKEPVNGSSHASKDSRPHTSPSQSPLPKDPVSISWSFDPMTEIPTLSHQSNGAREINDVIGNGHTSLNDRLKGNVLDLAAALNDAPIRDLRKAIGLNDRYVFINELFRGDETMYERSIKTINGFRILPEAEYWMQRELKVKMGWDETRSSTRHFYQLVKRRFS